MKLQNICFIIIVNYYNLKHIEGILRGYGYLQNFSADSVLKLYDTLLKEQSKY